MPASENQIVVCWSDEIVRQEVWLEETNGE